MLSAGKAAPGQAEKPEPCHGMQADLPEEQNGEAEVVEGAEMTERIDTKAGRVCMGEEVGASEDSLTLRAVRRSEVAAAYRGNILMVQRVMLLQQVLILTEVLEQMPVHSTCQAVVVAEEQTEVRSDLLEEMAGFRLAGAAAEVLDSPQVALEELVDQAVLLSSLNSKKQ